MWNLMSDELTDTIHPFATRSSTNRKKKKKLSNNGELIFFLPQAIWQVASPFVHRVQLALKLKGLKYEYIEEDLNNKSSSLLHHNPIYKKVPVLVHDGRPIVESYLILHYIHETWKENPLLPDDPYERSVVRFWCHFLTNKVGAVMERAFRASVEEKQAAIDEALDNWKLLEGEIRDGVFKGKRFFGGERIGMLDILLGVGHQWLLVMEEIVGFKLIDPVNFPCIYSWFQGFLEQEEVKEVLPDIEKLTEYVRCVVKPMNE